MDNRDENILSFQPTHDEVEEPVERAPQREPSIKKSKAGRIVAFVLVLCALIAVPVSKVILTKPSNGNAPNVERTGELVQAPRDRTVRRRVDGVNLEEVVGTEGLKQVRNYPKTPAELQEDARVQNLLKDRRDALTQREAELSAKLTEVNEQLAIVAVVKEDLVNAVQKLTATTNGLTIASNQVDKAANIFERALSEDSLVFGSGVREVTQRHPALTEYVIRSVINGTAVLSINSRPGQYVRWRVGSAVPGHGEVVEIGSENGRPKIVLTNGQLVG